MLRPGSMMASRATMAISPAAISPMRPDVLNGSVTMT